MAEATELANYLPLSFKTPNEQYIEFLWDAFETNATHEKYQFAFLAYHMLTMSFVYFHIWQIMRTEPKDFAMGLIGFGKDIEKSIVDRVLRCFDGEWISKGSNEERQAPAHGQGVDRDGEENAQARLDSV